MVILKVKESKYDELIECFIDENHIGNIFIDKYKHIEIAFIEIFDKYRGKGYFKLLLVELEMRYIVHVMDGRHM